MSQVIVYARKAWNETKSNNSSPVNVTEVNAYVHPLPFDTTGLILSTAIILTMMVFGIVANIFTIYVIHHCQNLRSIFNLFIASLCVSDCISAIISPLFLYRRTWGFNHWIISNFLCKFFWGADTGTSISTALHIVCFSFLRLVSIKWPHKYSRVSVTHAKICLAALWIISIGCGFVPFAIWFVARKIDRFKGAVDVAWPSCTISMTWVSQFRSYAVIGYTVFFYIPLVVVAVLALTVSYIIWARRRKRNKDNKTKKDISELARQRKENQAMLQLLLVVGSFLVGYIPHTAYHIFSMNTKTETHEDEVFHWWFGMTEYYLLRFSECLNPIFYNLASSKMRSESKKVALKICFCFSKIHIHRTETTSQSRPKTISRTTEMTNQSLVKKV